MKITKANALKEAQNLLEKYQYQKEQTKTFLQKFDQFNQRHSINKITNNNLENLINIKIETINQDIVASKIASTETPVMITMETQEMQQNQLKGGVDLICVLDVSGSMSGQKLNLLKQTLLFIIEQLTSKDRLSLISFNQYGKILCELLSVDTTNYFTLKSIVNELEARGATNIMNGMNLALEVLQKRNDIGNVTSIFLLSDGQDLRSPASEYELNINYYGIKDNFAIQTFGYGNDHDSVLMRDYAKLKHGSFYYIEEIQIIEECFLDALAGVSSVIAKNGLIQVQIEHPQKFSDLRIIKTYGDNWQFDENTQLYSITINQVLGGGTKNYLFALNIPPLKRPIEKQFKMNIPIVSIAVYFEPVDKSKQPFYKQFQLNVNFFEEEEQQLAQINNNKDVIVNHFRVKGADIMTKAISLLSQQKYEEAKQALQVIIQEIKESGLASSYMVLQVLLKDLNNSKDNCNPQLCHETVTAMTVKTYQHMAQQSQPQANGNASENFIYSNTHQTIKRQEYQTIHK